MSRTTLEQYIGRWSSEARIEGNRVIVGDRAWLAYPCRCGLKACDGWEMVPAGMTRTHRSTAAMSSAAARH